jgi:DNA mismatch repair protein MutS
LAIWSSHPILILTAFEQVISLKKPTEHAYTPMMQQYLEIKKDYSDYIVFFRLGDFYEMFFTDAIVASKELEIVLTGRDAGQPERVPMCGIPYHAANLYIERLIEKNFKVAIVEQVEDPKLTKDLVRREVIKLITPGTTTEEGMVNDKQNNFIASVGETKTHFLIAYADLSTGETAIVQSPRDIELLFNEISNLGCKEIVVANSFNQKRLRPFLETTPLVVSISDDASIPSYYRSLVAEVYDKDRLEAFGRLINYLVKTQRRELMHLQKAQLFESSSYLRLDFNTIRNLELLETNRYQNRKGSLFHLLDKCKTAMGSRFLKQTLLRPSLDRNRLENRYAVVEALNSAFVVREDLRNALAMVYDLERIVGRISFGNANAKDLLQLARSLGAFPKIHDLLERLHHPLSSKLSNDVGSFSTLSNQIEAAIVDNPPLTIREGGIIRPGYSDALDMIKGESTHGKDWLAEFEAKERERTGIRKLRIGYNRVFGYYIEVTKGQLDQVKDSFGYERKQTLANSERYVTPELKSKEELILGSEEDSIRLEYELFVQLRDEVKQHTDSLQRAARAIAETDMLIAFALIATENRYVKPVLTEERIVEIHRGRHPVVETLLAGEAFVENDLFLDKKTNILLITGPNMSGKSTYMRQLALIVILAQVGSFVPADSARLPIFDQIFTRIGAADDLTTGKSTFMVEMLEVNHALKNATTDSLILFDEIGRGTATYDGMALAQAIIEYAHHKLKCKILFSTHYHELTYLEDELPALRNVHVMAKEDHGSIVFLHKVALGPTDRSYGIHVARLANMPKPLIQRADDILTLLEQNHGYNIIKPQTVDLFNFEAAIETEQIELPYQGIIEQLKQLDTETMTPLQALNLLSELVAKLHE